MNSEHAAFQDCIGGNPSVIRNIKFLDLCLFGTVFQSVGVLALRLHGSLCGIFGSAIRLFCSGSLQILIIQEILRFSAGIFGFIVLTYQYPLVGIDHRFGAALTQDISLVQQIDAVTVFADAAQIMTDEHNGLAHFLEFFEFVITFSLEKYIADTQCFVHNQDLRLDVNGHSKSQTDEHTAGIGLHRLIDIIPDICKA